MAADVERSWGGPPEHAHLPGKASRRGVSSLQSTLVGAALVLNFVVVGFWVTSPAPVSLVVVAPLAAAPGLALLARGRPGRFRAVAGGLGLLYMAVAVAFLLFGGGSFLPAMFLLFAAAVAPDESGRRGVGYGVGLLTVALLVMACAVLLADAL